MSTWTAPATFASTTLTAATMNTEVRDHLNWLKGFVDLLTASTATDTGLGHVLEMEERAYPGVCGANRARLYAIDNGSGKTQLMVIFQSGAAIQLAIEP